MNLISNLSHKNWRTVNLALAAILALGIVFGKTSVAPTLSDALLSTLYYPFHLVKSYVVELSQVNDVNQQLATELTQARLQLAFMGEIQRENARLRNNADFEQPPRFKLLNARVVAVTGNGLPVSATINRGSRDSVQLNWPVINRSGLVGRISSVTPDFAHVQLLTDPRNRVAARIASSREMGIVRHVPGIGMTLASFPNQGNVSLGDTVISSGLGGIYPSGLQVGIVSSIVRPDNLPYAEVELTPSANFRSIEQLFVLIPENQP